MTPKIDDSISKIKIVLDIFQNEVDGDVVLALQKMTSDYQMTWVYEQPKSKELFPKTQPNIKSELEEVYEIPSRQYKIKNIAENGNIVFIELIESYNDEITGFLYQTPEVIVLEFEGDKIKKGRHYCDPNISYLSLKKEDIENVYGVDNGSDIVISKRDSNSI